MGGLAKGYGKKLRTCESTTGSWWD